MASVLFANASMPSLLFRLLRRFHRLFRSGKAVRTQVAALPFRHGSNGLEILLITSRDTGRWVIPKGWPEEGEAWFTAAAREAEEEAGISGSIAERELGRFHYLKRRRKSADIPCEVVVYPLRVDDLAESWREKGQRRRQWFARGKAAALVAEPELQGLIRTFSGLSGRQA